MVQHADIDHTGVTGVGGSPTEADVTFTDITTNNASTSKHGYLKKLDNNAAHFMDGTGAWSTPGGGAAHSFLGYNTIGGSTEVMTQYRWYTKQITVAANGLLTSLGVHIKWGADDLGAIMAGVFEDVNGSPDVPNKALFATSIGTGADTVDLSESGATRNARWFTLPCGLYVPAGDYWIGFATRNNSTQATIYYDGSGSDRYWTPGGLRVLDGAYASQTDSTRKYSIRASFLPA